MNTKSLEYKIVEGGLHERFWLSRAKIQFIGGAYANGKTTAIIVKALMVARDYPGCRILFARATKVKLRTTLQREFFKWCPKSWIKSWNKGEGELELANGTLIDFRYIGQKSSGDGEESTSNLLSANYALIVIDQTEDPEIEEKDIDDLLGRLRDNTAEYAPTGDHDASMPRTGPRWLFLTANPTGNWVYRKFIKPVHDYKNNIANPNMILSKQTGLPLIELFEGSVYDNAHNLEKDYIETMESTYQGQMYDRYVLGKWVSYEGLVYPMVSQDHHYVSHVEAVRYMQRMRESRFNLTMVEGYDHGLRSPSCYLCGFVDDLGNITLVDGFYRPECPVAQSASLIKNLRLLYNIRHDNPIAADPDIFRRKGTSDATKVGVSVARLFDEQGLSNMARGMNTINSGIAQVSTYLAIDQRHKNPYTGVIGAPRMYFSDRLDFLKEEITNYHWKRQKSTGELTDTPNDKNDHAMDTMKYIVASRPQIASLPPAGFKLDPMAFMWHVMPKTPNQANDMRSSRHG